MCKACRSMFRYLILTVLTLAVFHPALALSHPPGFVYVEGEKLMLDGEQFIVKGYNYYPRDYGWTSMVDWEWEQVDRELALAREYGANTIRTGFAYQYATGDVSCEKVLAVNQVQPEYREAIERFLDIAGKHDLKVIFWLGDICWKFWNPAYYEGLQKYLESLIPAFAGDTRILAWDLVTDLDGSMLQPPPIGGFGEVSHSTKIDMLTLLRSMAATVRELDPNHPITVGFCWPSSSLLVQDFTDFLMPQFLGGDAPNILTSNGAAVMDEYGKWENERETVIASLEEKIHFMQSQLKRPMPIVLAEYGAPSTGEGVSLVFQQEVYETVLEMAFLRMKVAGALNWALTDFTWPPKAYTSVPSDESQINAYEQSFGIFDLDYNPKPSAEVARKYYADHPEISFQNTPMELTFVFSKSFFPKDFDPNSDDERELCVAFDKIRYQDESGRVLSELDIGTVDARSYLDQGFFADEGPWETDAENFAWVGGIEKTAQVSMPFPEGTQNISFHAFNQLTEMQMDVFVDGEKIDMLTLEKGWMSYNFKLPAQEPLEIGSTHIVRGSLNLPISEGTVDIQTSYDQSTWQDVARVIPVNGRFSAPIQFERGGTMWLRAVWSGVGYYLTTTSAPLVFELPHAESTLTVTETPMHTIVVSTIEPETKSSNGRLYIGLGIVFFLLTGWGAFVVLRRRTQKS